MATRAIEHLFTGATTPYTAYDATRTVLGDLIKQYSGPNPEDNYAGPVRLGKNTALSETYGLARPSETSTIINSAYPHATRWAKKSGYYTTGTVSTSGATVTGSETAWLSSGVPVNARIGFGASNPTSITTWYTIQSINADTSITLQSTPPSQTVGTAYVIDLNYNIDWVFVADFSAAAATRRISLWTFSRESSAFTWRGFVTLTYPAGGGSQTIRGMRAVYQTYTTGTISASGATVTGSGTAWNTDRIAVGSRIGFGSTDPTQISTWYYINAISSETSLTTQVNVTAAGTGGTAANLSLTAGTAYVIEDLRVLTATTSTVAACGGLSVVNGLSFDDFTVGGTTISAATTVDKLKAVYSLVDINAAFVTAGTVSTSGSSTTITGSGTSWAAASHLGCMIGFGSTNPASITTWYTITAVASTTSLTISSAVTLGAGTAYVIQGTNRTAGGVAIEARDSWTQQFCYLLDITTAATTPQVFKYNFRANLTTLGGVAQGKSAAGFVLATGIQTVTGNTSQTNNGRIGTLTHGPGASVESLYFATTTRVCRAPVSAITQGSTTWVSDSMIEVPPGGTGTFGASSVLAAVEISDQIDRLIVTTTGAAGATLFNRAYITRYNTISTPFDLPFIIDSRQYDQAAADSDSVPHPSVTGAPLGIWSEDGLAYILRATTTTSQNLMYAVPIGADWDFASGTIKQRLITPSLPTSNATKFKRALIAQTNTLGSGGLRVPLESARLYYRTSGISDDTGSWTPVDATGDLSSAGATSAIQFMVEFRTIGSFCIPARIHSITCVYEDETTDSHYQPSVGYSSTTNKQFAWRFSTAFGGTVPTLRVRLFDAVTGGLLVDDDTATPTGTFERSTDGGATWSAYATTDKANETTYIRYTPSSLGNDIKVRALLTQA